MLGQAGTILLQVLILSNCYYAQSAPITDSTPGIKNPPFIKINDRIAKQTTIIYRTDTLEFKSPRLFNFAKNAPADMWYIAKSPFQKENIIGLSAVVASTALLIAYDQRIVDWIKNTSEKVSLEPETNYAVLFKMGDTKIVKVPLNVNTTLYQIGEGGSSMMLAGGIWIYGKIAHNYRAIATASDLAETFVAMGALTQVIKRISGRESPFVATAQGGRWKPFPSFAEFQRNTPSYDAFPSGHLATLTATLTVLAYNYPEKKWIRPVGYVIMGLSSWAMMNTEVHWPGDYPLAIAVGYLSGKITTLRHKKITTLKTVP